MANIYVNHSGSSTPPYDTEEKAATDIQVALDAVQAGDTVWIKADQDYGGTYYKHSNNGWVVINANNGAFNAFGAGDKNRLRWRNLKTINVNTAYIVYNLIPTTEQHGYLLQNCVITGGKFAVYAANLANPIIRDCIFTGTYTTIAVFGAIYLTTSCVRGAIIQDCNFSHGNTTRSIYCINSGMNVIEHNIFNITGTVTTVMEIAVAGFSVNNVIYEASSGNITNGIKIPSGGYSTVIYNNIIIGCTTSINDAAPANFGGWNCFYNNGSNWTLREGDMVADPQFMNAANGDFRLKPTSPCLNRGKPTWGGGYTSIGAWQRKSLLR